MSIQVLSLTLHCENIKKLKANENQNYNNLCFYIDKIGSSRNTAQYISLSTAICFPEAHSRRVLLCRCLEVRVYSDKRFLST